MILQRDLSPTTGNRPAITLGAPHQRLNPHRESRCPRVQSGASGESPNRPHEQAKNIELGFGFCRNFFVIFGGERVGRERKKLTGPALISGASPVCTGPDLRIEAGRIACVPDPICELRLAGSRILGPSDGTNTPSG